LQQFFDQNTLVEYVKNNLAEINATLNYKMRQQNKLSIRVSEKNELFINFKTNDNSDIHFSIHNGTNNKKPICHLKNKMCKFVFSFILKVTIKNNNKNFKFDPVITDRKINHDSIANPRYIEITNNECVTEEQQLSGTVFVFFNFFIDKILAAVNMNEIKYANTQITRSILEMLTNSTTNNANNIVNTKTIIGRKLSSFIGGGEEYEVDITIFHNIIMPYFLIYCIFIEDVFNGDREFSEDQIDQFIDEINQSNEIKNFLLKYYFFYLDQMTTKPINTTGKSDDVAEVYPIADVMKEITLMNKLNVEKMRLEGDKYNVESRNYNPVAMAFKK
jgi:hypothetical protein